MKKTTTILFAFLLAIEANATIHSEHNNTHLANKTINVDINKDGQWDVKLKGSVDGTAYWVEPFYLDASNFVAIKVFTGTPSYPVPYKKGSDMNKVGVWVGNKNKLNVFLKDFSNQGTNYLALKLIEDGVAYCAWIELSGELTLGFFAWEDDDSKCMKAGNFDYPSSTGIDEITSESDITLSPCPASDNLVISSLHAPADVVIYDLQGKKMLNLGNILSGSSISVSTLSEGLYFIDISFKDGLVERKKFVILRN